MENTKRTSSNRKITSFILILVFLLSTVSFVSAGSTITVTFSFYGPYWDINNDGTTNYLDISSLVSHYGNTVSPRPRYGGDYRWDINGDGTVDYLDVSALVGHYNEGWLV